MNQSQGNVPFSWENKPGISKETPQLLQSFKEGDDHYTLQKKLPPPPCRLESAKVPIHYIDIPLPPCVFQPPLRTCSKGSGVDDGDDPFLAAYKECTKGSNKGKKGRGWFVLKKGFFSFACKGSCGVRDDSLVRVSQLPIERDID
ncbi:hypothetical protein ES288_D06G028800v1 [Gossypium darwinii]|uniref:Uncharacterized protein n=1 Tax=Gossypium darwinii TaxID=34276 RepID=A0A5D2C1C3_GOSDA|nr:hypothetical protein ES288_D06G028800v1 [Gossypium darwinii]